jgi:hypothetical protein
MSTTFNQKVARQNFEERLLDLSHELATHSDLAELERRVSALETFRAGFARDAPAPSPGGDPVPFDQYAHEKQTRIKYYQVIVQICELVDHTLGGKCTADNVAQRVNTMIANLLDHAGADEGPLASESQNGLSRASGSNDAPASPATTSIESASVLRSMDSVEPAEIAALRMELAALGVRPGKITWDGQPEFRIAAEVSLHQRHNPLPQTTLRGKNCDAVLEQAQNRFRPTRQSSPSAK